MCYDHWLEIIYSSFFEHVHNEVDMKDPLEFLGYLDCHLYRDEETSKKIRD